MSNSTLTNAALMNRRHAAVARGVGQAHEKVESTVRYLGIEVDDALEMAEDTEA